MKSLSKGNKKVAPDYAGDSSVLILNELNAVEKETTVKSLLLIIK